MFNDVEHTFSDTKLSFHTRRKFTYWGVVWHTLDLMNSRLFY